MFPPTHDRATPWQWLRAAGTALLGPPIALLSDDALRVKSRLLSMLLLSMICVFGVVDISLSLLISGYVVPWPGYLFLAGAYTLNRFGNRYHAASRVALAMFPVIIVGETLLFASPGTPSTTMYFALPGIMAAVFLRGIVEAAAYAALLLAVIAGLFLVVPHRLGGYAGMIVPLAVTGIGSLLALTIAHYRDAIEHLRHAQLRRSELRYRSFVDNFLGIAYQSLPGTLKPSLFHGKVFEITGYPAERFLSGDFSWEQVVHPDDIAHLKQETERSRARPGYVADLEYRICHADGTTRWVRDISSCLVVGESDTMNSQGAIYDITAQRGLEARLRQAEKMKAVGMLAGGVAHDFNNQLAAIMGFAELVRVDLEEADPRREDLKQIITAARHSADLTRKLLSFARKGAVEVRPVNVHAVVDEVISLLKRTIDKRITVVRRLNAAAADVAADASELQNALLNVALNARDAMPDGGELIFSTEVITIDSSQPAFKGHTVTYGDYLRLSITDTGRGMNQETLARVFEPFFTTKTTGKGTGLGLAAVFGTVKAAGGFVNAHSEVGHGSTFSLYLPLCDEHAHESDEATTAALPRDLGVMVVDDEPTVVRLTAAVLRRAGERVEVFTGGSAAISWYRKHRSEIDLVVLDMIMPDLHGRDALSQILEINPEAKVLLVSGYSANGTVRELLDNGAAGFLHKPYTMSQLLDAAARIFGSS